MAEFVNPFGGMTPGRKLGDRELARAIRMCLAAEEEAVHMYEAMADASGDPLAAKVLQDIADKEKVHAGEFQRLLNLLLDDEPARLAEGAAEVDEINNNLKKSRPEMAGGTNENQLTVGGRKIENRMNFTRKGGIR